MRTWGIVSQKGGSGKTTLLLHIAIAATAKGLAVSVLDLDPQRSAEQWSELRERRLMTEEPTVVHGAPADLDGMLEAARETGTDLVLIDTPPSVDKSLIYAAAAADVVIVPTRSGVLDQFALKETLDYLVRIHALAKTVVIRNAPGRDAKANSAIERIVKDFGVATLAVTIEDQVDLAASLGEGKGITESAPKRKSAKAIHELYQQLNAFDRKLARTRKQVTA